MRETYFKYPELAKSITSLFGKVKNTLQESSNEEVKILSNRVPTSLESNSKELKIVFAGQYSAGKSTIIKVLTGNKKIKVGSGITTEKIEYYNWKGFRGVEIIDTPGIHTEKRPDHDALSYQAISSADLIVFVVTNELFDDNIGAHFRKLAIDKGKGHETLLVINKMQREASGNSVYSQEILSENLQEVLQPFHPQDLQTTFIDAESALIAKKEVDEDLKESLINKSGIANFINALNEFINKKELNGRLSTPLYELEQILQEASNSESTQDEDLDALRELLTQKRRALLEARQEIRLKINQLVQNVVPDIREKGRSISELITENAKEDEINEEIEKARFDVQKISDKLVDDIQLSIESVINELNLELSELANSEFAKSLSEKLSTKLSSSEKNNYGGVKSVGSVASKVGSFLANHSFNKKDGVEGLLKLANFSNSSTHKIVLKVGKIVGHKFKPWEAVKWARVVGNAGKVLSVVGSVVSIVLEFKQDADEKKMGEELREARTSIRKGFTDVANEIEKYSLDVFDKCNDEIIRPELKSVDMKLMELQNMQNSQNEFITTIIRYRDDTRSLISEIHQLDDLNATNS